MYILNILSILPNMEKKQLIIYFSDIIYVVYH